MYRNGTDVKDITKYLKSNALTKKQIIMILNIIHEDEKMRIYYKNKNGGK